VGHMMEEGHCVATVHAEANAIIQAAKNGVAIEGSSIYTTASPCWPCFKLIANAGCRRIVFGEFYRDERIFEYAQRIGIELVELAVPARPDVQPADTGHARPVTGTQRQG
jgi:dCMP deaminase